MCWTGTRQVDCGDSGAVQGRQWIIARLTEALRPHDAGDRTRDSDLIYDAGLVAGELISNAARACRDDVRVTLDIHHSWIKVAVWDDGPGRPTPRAAGPAEAGGRGLRIVAALSADWGVRPDAHGKSVWSTLSMPTRSTKHLDCNDPGPRSG